MIAPTIAPGPSSAPQSPLAAPPFLEGLPLCSTIGLPQPPQTPCTPASSPQAERSPPLGRTKPEFGYLLLKTRLAERIFRPRRGAFSANGGRIPALIPLVCRTESTHDGVRCRGRRQALWRRAALLRVARLSVALGGARRGAFSANGSRITAVVPLVCRTESTHDGVWCWGRRQALWRRAAFLGDAWRCLA